MRIFFCSFGFTDNYRSQLGSCYDSRSFCSVIIHLHEVDWGASIMIFLHSVCNCLSDTIDQGPSNLVLMVLKHPVLDWCWLQNFKGQGCWLKSVCPSINIASPHCWHSADVATICCWPQAQSWFLLDFDAVYLHAKHCYGLWWATIYPWVKKNSTPYSCP